MTSSAVALGQSEEILQTEGLVEELCDILALGEG